MKERIQEAEKRLQSSTSRGGETDSEAVVRAIEKGFKEHVKPTWSEWKKEAAAATRDH